MKNNIRVDFMANEIIVAKGFYAKACVPGTTESIELLKVQKMYPNMCIVEKETKHSRRRPNETKGLTYKYMRRFISILDSQNLINFEKAKFYYENLYDDNATVYYYMKEWFLNTYPNHKEMVVIAEPQATFRRNLLSFGEVV